LKPTPPSTHGHVLAYLNGHFLPRSTASVPVDDRGFVFGDGVYEVWRAVGGALFEMDRHLARLQWGLDELRIPRPELANPDRLRDVARRLLTDSDLLDGDATLYVEITRGAAPRTHQFPAGSVSPTVYATVNRLVTPEDVRTRGAECITVPDVRWLRCDLKTIQLLPNVLAKQAAAERGAIEAIMVRDGVVTEGSHTNVIGVFDGLLRTHQANHLVLQGVTRGVVLDIARSLGMAVREEAFGVGDLPRLDELFLVGTTTDVMPVVRVDGKPVGEGTPGPVARRLQTELRGRLDSLQPAEHPAIASIAP
jgi:D-alanine transaminase